MTYLMPATREGRLGEEREREDGRPFFQHRRGADKLRAGTVVVMLGESGGLRGREGTTHKNGGQRWEMGIKLLFEDR
jgi:hypothetical protein